MSNEITRTAAQVAADINKVKLNLAVAVVVSSIEIGRLLLEAKALVPYGEWGAWLEANVDFSESKAQSLMRRYKEYGDGQIDMITGTSDLDFFAFLSDSQMDALLALPKPERREFVEEHREELESGEMSVRKMQAEIAKLKMDNEAKTEALKKATGHIERLEKDCNDMNALLDEERRKPAPEPMVQEVIVHSPSEEDIEKIRAEVEATYKKQAKASAAGADPNVMRIQLALEDFKRTVTVVSATLGKMKDEGGEAAQKADKLQANVEKILGSLISEAGWTV